MHALLKIALVTAGVGAVGAAGYCLYQRHKKTTAAQPKVMGPEVQPVSAAAPVEVIPEVTPMLSLAVDELVLPTLDAVTPEAVIAEPVVIKPSTAHVLSRIGDKTITIHGIETQRSDDRFVFTDGHRQIVTPELSHRDANLVRQIQNFVSTRVTMILHNRAKRAMLTRRAKVGRLTIRTYTTAEHSPDEPVLVQITNHGAPVFDGLRTLYLLVEREDLVIATEACAFGSAEWSRQIGVLHAHLLYAINGRSIATEAELMGIKQVMVQHFQSLGKQLHAAKTKVDA